MLELPKLPEAVQRKLDLKWDELIERRGFDGSHLNWHESKERRRAFARIPFSLAHDPPESNVTHTWEGRIVSWEEQQAKLKEAWATRTNSPETVDSIGISETVELSKLRFLQLQPEYQRLWAMTAQPRTEVFAAWLVTVTTNVISECRALWIGEWHVRWFVRACEPRLAAGLNQLAHDEVKRTRKLEIKHLENPHVSLSALVATGGDFDAANTLARHDETVRLGREASERAEAIRHSMDRQGSPAYWRDFDEFVAKTGEEQKSLATKSPGAANDRSESLRGLNEGVGRLFHATGVTRDATRVMAGADFGGLNDTTQAAANSAMQVLAGADLKQIIDAIPGPAGSLAPTLEQAKGVEAFVAEYEKTHRIAAEAAKALDAEPPTDKGPDLPSDSWQGFDFSPTGWPFGRGGDEALPEKPAQQTSKRLAPVKQTERYAAIDIKLKEIALSLPASHEDVFRFLDGRVAHPQAEPFKSARGWHAGFKKDPARARVWLSKSWSRLGLPAFARGPK